MFKARSVYIKISMILIFGISLFTQVQAQSVTIFEGARLIVGDGSDPIEGSVFIVVDDRITHVGKKGVLALPSNASRVNLNGKTVMPAIIDAHKHTSNDRDFNKIHIFHRLLTYCLPTLFNTFNPIGCIRSSRFRCSDTSSRSI